MAAVAVNDDGTAKLAWGESIDVQINLQALPMSRTYRAVGKFGVRAVAQILHVADDKVFATFVNQQDVFLDDIVRRVYNPQENLLRLYHQMGWSLLGFYYPALVLAA